MNRTTKWLLGFAVLAIAVIVLAAPPPGTYITSNFFTTNNADIIGTNGVTVSSNFIAGGNPAKGRYVIDGSALVGKTNIFNPNQFSQVGVGGTNVNIKSGVLISNEFVYGQTNFGSLLATNPFFAYGSAGFDFVWMTNLADGVGFYTTDSGAYALKINGAGGVFFPLQTANTIARFAAAPDQELTSIPNAAGALTNNSSGTFGWFPGFITFGSSNTYTFNANQFALTGTGGTNVNIKSGSLQTNVNLFGLTTNNGSFNNAGPQTNYDVTRLKGQVTIEAQTRIAAELDVGGIIASNGITNLTLTASTLMQADANQKESSIANGTGYLRDNGSGTFSYDIPTNSYTFNANQFSLTGTGGTNVNIKSGALITNINLFGLNTNNGSMDQAGAQTNYGTLNLQSLSPNTVLSLDTNKSVASIPNPTVGAGQPLIFNGTNGGVFQSVGDGWLLDEEFNEQVAVTAPWTTLSAGTAGATIKTASTNWGEITYTNGPTAADRAGIVNPTTTATYVITNTEMWCFVRVMCRTKNSASISNFLAFGLMDAFSGAAGGKGIYVQAAKTNGIWEAITGNDSGSGVTNTLTIAVTADEWREFAWHLDQTQTNVVFYSGNSVNGLTVWCTNAITLPTASVNFAFTSRRMATQTSGSATNHIDHFKVWKRNLW